MLDLVAVGFEQPGNLQEGVLLAAFLGVAIMSQQYAHSII
ncbi:MAG: hypothetical protein BWZ10_01700 [candidate division BRC1 bacterium ADurb.BinA364]|nr:MAG: hypothetical protein BWZ10_01700 [candidate division BRC1 bacterium ADurb.BinA364]